jgi:hypothetical protein
VSARLGAALAGYILDLPGEFKFVLVEGVSEDLAESMAEAWQDDELRLAVTSQHPERFGDRALRDVAATALRNQGPICLVLCEGAQLADRQSLRAFESVAPSVLLREHAGLIRLAEVPPSAPLDGVPRHVRGALLQMAEAERPSAPAVAAYLDRCAAGDDPLQVLPALGAFADHAAGGTDSRRILANLSLASRRRGEQLSRPVDMRRRAARILGQRPDTTPAAAREEADHVLALLQSGSDELLSAVTYDEASGILEQKSGDLVADVERELRAYRREKSDDPDVAWARYEDAARLLRDPEHQKRCALDLLGFDEIEVRRVFDQPIRRRLEQLLKDQVLSASRPSCPELALVRCAVALGGIGAIDLLQPVTSEKQQQNRTSATQRLAVACARLRLGRLLRDLQGNGAQIDGSLLLGADDGLWAEIFQDAQLDAGAELPTVLLRVRSPHDDPVSRQISWRPDLDDVATLRAALAFAEQPALTLQAAVAPGLKSFCSGPAPVPAPVPRKLSGLAKRLQEVAADALRHGLAPEPLDAWATDWARSVDAARAAGDTATAEELTLAGAAVRGHAVALTALAPLKAEWLGQYLDALWSMVWGAFHAAGDPGDEPYEETAAGVARCTAAHYPAHLRLRARDRVLLPTGEGRIWSVYGAEAPDDAHLGGEALRDVIERLLTLQPDAAGHLRCIAYGPGAATLLIEQAVVLIGKKLGRAGARAELRNVEIFCIEEGGWRPSPEALAQADALLVAEGRRALEVRYLRSLKDAKAMLQRYAPGSPAAHLALVTGLTAGGGRLTISSPDVEPPPLDPEVLFAPRVWMRPRQTRRLLLMPPAASTAGIAWLRLMNAIEDDWPDEEETIRAPELRTASGEMRDELLAVHELALWVATLDPYASRDSLTHALQGKVAILHQDRRLGGDSPLSLVISQRSGGPADRAVGRRLRASGIVSDFDSAVEIGGELRKIASEGYAVLALEAATTGAGINELVGHVVAFSLLATRTTPWPLPPNCRLLLVSLDDYKHWFPGKRADLLVVALDTQEGGIHAAAIEVKARTSDVDTSARDALDQLKQTLHTTRFAAYPESGSVHSRLWLNRLAEASCAVARESNLKLERSELDAIERFRRGDGPLEWAGLGLVFGPAQENIDRHYHQDISGDRVPIVVHSVQLTEELLQQATAVSLTDLRTVEAQRPPLDGGRVRRRPERPKGPEPTGEPDEPTPAPPSGQPTEVPAATVSAAEQTEESVDEPTPEDESASPPAVSGSGPGAANPFAAPVLGWDAGDDQPVLWRAAGEDAELDNGHTEIWGASGAGKTQFTMALLAQLAAHSGAKFGIADFKNDYSDDSSDRFPERTGARFIDLWDTGAPFNPLALAGDDEKEKRRAIIELRDIVDVATQSFARLGVRQKDKLRKALEQAYEASSAEGRWPTMLTLNDMLDEDLRGVIGDMTREEIFRDGPPLGDAIEENLVFGLHEIPGNGLTTVLTAGFILSALHLRIQSLPQTANTIRYLMVVDEAHRVAAFKAVKSMLQEGRSKGLAVILATQQPGDLPDEVATNANTRICFRLPDSTIANAAARRLDASDPTLAEQIRTLDRGEAFVSLGGARPRLLRMPQFWRDRERLELPG